MRPSVLEKDLGLWAFRIKSLVVVITNQSSINLKCGAEIERAGRMPSERLVRVRFGRKNLLHFFSSVKGIVAPQKKIS